MAEAALRAGLAGCGRDERDGCVTAEDDWKAWIRGFAAVLAAALLLAFGFVLAMDPFGSRLAPGEPARPLMDLNQRFMYPQLARSRSFDAAILGTSTLRLIDPALLAPAGGRFVNLAMNAATPWEQAEIAGLFLRHAAAPAALVWGVDAAWCDPAATAPEKRLTPRPFPPWLYDDDPWNDWPELLSATSLEIAGRVLANRLGLMPPRIRGDGYEVFTPPEASYDLARARLHLYAARSGVPFRPRVFAPPRPVAAAEAASWRFPALAWLERELARLPPSARRLLVLPPVHAASLPGAGSAEDQRLAACKGALAALAARTGAAILDYAFASAVTEDDANYWDPLHYRLPVARRIEADITAALAGRAPANADGAVRFRPAAR